MKHMHEEIQFFFHYSDMSNYIFGFPPIELIQLLRILARQRLRGSDDSKEITSMTGMLLKELYVEKENGSVSSS